jgi:hypothetical protein
MVGRVYYVPPVSNNGEAQARRYRLVLIALDAHTVADILCHR